MRRFWNLFKFRVLGIKPKAFLICPVRGHKSEELAPLVAEIESRGIDLYWPHRDTDQNDPIGFRICTDNCKAISRADVVFIYWDGSSQGSLFDFGMSFKAGKPVIPIELPAATIGKSFQNMIAEWGKRSEPTLKEWGIRWDKNGSHRQN